MYDFIKVAILPQYKGRLLKHPLLDFEGIYSERTGATRSKKIAQYNGMKIIVNDSGYTELQGSIHKFKNGGLHNYDDFSLAEVDAVINQIEDLFQFNFRASSLKNLEFGVNICPPANSKDVLNNLMLHKQEKFKDVSMISGNYKQAIHQQFYFKAYDKYVQYCDNFDLNEPILRLELKYVKMVALQKIGVRTVEDLLKMKQYEALRSMLLKQWNSVLLYDNTIVYKGLNKHTGDVKRHQWQNPNYWLLLSKQARNKQKCIYRQIVAQHSEDVHSQISHLISQKWDDLTGKGLLINRACMMC